MAQSCYSSRAGRRKHREAVWLLLNNLCVYCWLQAVICWMGIQWMGVEDSVCLGVCVCLFLFVAEIDTWKCVCLFVCLRIEAGDCFLLFLFVHEIKGSVHRKHIFSLSQGGNFHWRWGSPSFLKSYFCPPRFYCFRMIFLLKSPWTSSSNCPVTTVQMSQELIKMWHLSKLQLLPCVRLFFRPGFRLSGYIQACPTLLVKVIGAERNTCKHYSLG